MIKVRFLDDVLDDSKRIIMLVGVDSGVTLVNGLDGVGENSSSTEHDLNKQKKSSIVDRKV